MNAKITLINPEKKLSEFKSTFTSLKEDEPIKINIKSNELFENEARNNIVKWLVFLCDTLNFNFQTLNRAIIIFDKYISVTDLLENEDLTQEKMNLITIGCLSLATKLEEINCNYVKFFTDKVINLPDCQIFSVKDLTKMELIILKKLSFKTLYTTAYDFLLYFLDIFQYFYNPSNYFFENIKNHALFLMKQNINTNLYISMSQSDYAIFCLYQAFLEIGNNDIMQKILNILILLNNDIDNNDLKRQNRTDDISDKFEKIDIFRNSQVNIFSLSSF
jgi:hypothetical protein